MLWLARKAFFGHVPFPCVHVDTSFKIPEMIAFRDRLAREWNLNLIVGQNTRGARGQADVPRRRARPRGLLHGAQARPAGGGHRAEGIRGGDRRHPPRRGGNARQGAILLAAQQGFRVEFPRPAAGVLGAVPDEISSPARTCASIRCCTGPSSTSGNTSTAKTSRWSACIMHAMAAAIDRWAARRAPARWNPTPRRPRRSSTNSARPRSPSAAPARRTRRVKMLLSVCERADICDFDRRLDFR